MGSSAVTRTTLMQDANTCKMLILEEVTQEVSVLAFQFFYEPKISLKK